MAVVQFLQLVMTRRIHRPQWYNTVVTRAKGVLNGGRTNTTKNATGNRVIQRTRTHSWYKKSK
jgi:hypothetical protein